MRRIVEWVVLAAGFALAGAAAAVVARPAGASGDAAESAIAPGGVAEGGAEPAFDASGLPTIVLNGRRIDPAAPIRPQVLDAARAYLSAPIDLRAAGETRTFTRAQLGATVPVGRIVEEIERALRFRTALRRILERAGGEHALPVLVDVDDRPALGRLLAFKNMFDREPTPAKYDFGAGRVRPEEPGRRLSLHEALAALHDAFEAGAPQLDLRVERIEPGLRLRDVSGADFSALLGWYETPYARIPEKETRNFNLQHAASFIDGTIVMPGEALDFNAVVGERTEVRGFKVAPVIAEGELIDGIGGGTCQIASTVFAASFFAGLDLVRRRPHSRPSSYVLLGLDATVVYPSVNLEVRNPFDFPIAFRVRAAEGKVRVEVRGARRVYDVTFIRDVYQVQPFQTQTIDVPEWPAGIEVVSQRGINGYRMRRHRILCERAACVRESAESHYPPTTHIVRRGTNPSLSMDGFPLPAGDTSQPYSADRHMMVVQSATETRILRKP